jgi:orotidine-5'-phosphate decarboxylase
MNNYADRLLSAIESKSSPCVVGLDPRLELMPGFISEGVEDRPIADRIRHAIATFNHTIIEAVYEIVPAVKLQIAFYEQYGLPGLFAFDDTIKLARDFGLVVIVDAKRNDISSTAQAYANAFLGRTNIFGELKAIFDVDCITVSPFLGRDSLTPFIDACAAYGKGVFILVKTSNPGSVDLQDQKVASNGRPIYRGLANIVDECGKGIIGDYGYSSVGAVVGATFPHEARDLRRLMPHAIILVPGYGAQGGTAEGAAACFNQDRRGAVVNASRSIIYPHDRQDISREEFKQTVRNSAENMRREIVNALPEARASAAQ